MTGIPVTVTQIQLGNLVPTHLVMQATKGGNGLTKGALYHPLAVNHRGEVAVSPITDVQAIVKGPRGMWHPMIAFDWQTTGIEAGNDN